MFDFLVGSPNGDGVSLTRRNNVGSIPSPTTKFIAETSHGTLQSLISSPQGMVSSILTSASICWVRKVRSSITNTLARGGCSLSNNFIRACSKVRGDRASKTQCGEFDSHPGCHFNFIHRRCFGSMFRLERRGRSSTLRRWTKISA